MAIRIATVHDVREAEAFLSAQQVWFRVQR